MPDFYYHGATASRLTAGRARRTPRPVNLRTSLPALALALAAGCQNSPPEPTPDPPVTPPSDRNEHTRAVRPARHPTPGDSGGPTRPAGDPPATPPEPPKPPQDPPSDDPLKGKFTLADATKGLPPGKQLVATIETSLGKVECKLFDDKAPITVANFVGLARGVRPWRTPAGTWEKKPAYDGTIFHRIIKGFMIQGGDAMKNGSGEAGYVIPDEVWTGATHDHAGQLCMANRGKNTNSAQFFITDAAAPHLDGGYTIFGECGPVDVIHTLASVEMLGGRPKTPPDIKKVTVTRK
jgi:peptidyl-prolyl cis-trans isomerase A (cyclophilin A)